MSRSFPSKTRLGWASNNRFSQSAGSAVSSAFAFRSFFPLARSRARNAFDASLSAHVFNSTASCRIGE